MQRNWIAPLMGIVFVGLLIGGILLTGGLGDNTNATKKSAQEIVNYYQDHKDRQMAGAFMIGASAITFLFFGGLVRKLLRDAEGPGGVLSAVSLVGVTVLAIGIAVGATLHLATADLADDIDPVAIQALNGLDYDYFIPIAVGMSTFLLATGISVVRHGVLPKWLGWAAIVLGVADYTPAGFFGFILSLVWILVVSILLATRAREGRAPAVPAPA